MLRFLVRIALCFLAVAALAANAQTKRIWGVNGHPDQVDYASWDRAAVDRQLRLLNEMGAEYYRIGYMVEANRNNPAVLDYLVPRAMELGIKVVPVVFVEPDVSRFNGTNASYVAQMNYDAGYAQGKRWAEHAISRNYDIEYWELGNETSLAKRKLDDRYFFSYTGQGVDKSQWREEIGGALPAMAGVLRGMYWGIKHAYRNHNREVKLLFGDHAQKFGYVRMIMDYGNARFFPGDILSWHWYSPSFGRFTEPLVPGNNATRPSAYAASFGKDIWITEIGREEKVPPTYGVLGGSSSNLWNENQNWKLQSDELMSALYEMVSVPQVKGIFVYELYDGAPHLTGYPLAERVSQGFHGLVNFGGYRKDAFYMYRNFIANYP